jgi:CheY-like chemotaxis protein
MIIQPDLSEHFIDQIKDALEKLYDFQALQNNALAQRFSSKGSGGHTAGSHQLRSQIIDAIETLNPGQNVTADSGTARTYNLIYMHYVGRLTIQQAAWEIGVSLRQAYRDLRRGQEQVSAILWTKLSAVGTGQQQEESAKEELSRLEENTVVSSLQELLEVAMRPIQVLADKYLTEIVVDAPAMPIMRATNATIAQQTLTHLLSQIIQQIRPSKLVIRLCDSSQFMIISYHGDSSTDLQIHATIQQMMDQIRWKIDYYTDGMSHEISLTSSQRRALIMVIDDNEGSFHLLQRYLNEDSYSVMSAANTEAGLQTISQLQPDAIILDVMMPGIDGWELLQRLRAKKETSKIPVIICSVINDPELAFVLGAASYIPKPVDRDALLHALQALQRQRVNHDREDL